VNARVNKKPAGFHLLAIDRFMRSSHAVPVLAVLAAASIVALLLAESGMNFTWPDWEQARTLCLSSAWPADLWHPALSKIAAFRLLWLQ
jgi:hypothetical protein